MTIARWDTDTVELYVLGDSPAVLQRIDGTTTELLDARLQAVAREERQAYRYHLTSGADRGPELRRLLARLQHAQRSHQNRPGGHWIAAAEPDAADHAITAEYPLADVTTVVLLSDGAAAGVDDYATPTTWQDALIDLDTQGPAPFLAAVHAIEDQDPDARRWPRAKRHDDKTIAVMRTGRG